MNKEKISKAILNSINCKHKNLDHVDEKLSFFKRRFHIDREKFIPFHCIDCGLLMPINKEILKK